MDEPPKKTVLPTVTARRAKRLRGGERRSDEREARRRDRWSFLPMAQRDSSKPAAGSPGQVNTRSTRLTAPVWPSCPRRAVLNTRRLRTVSYTHLTLPTNREV